MYIQRAQIKLCSQPRQPLLLKKQLCVPQSRLHSATEKRPDSEESGAKAIAWSCHMEGHAKKRVERYCELANNKRRTAVQGLNTMS